MLVIIEESFQISVWCREIVDGLRHAARKKRTPLTVSTKVEDIAQSEERAIILVGAETDWINRAVEQTKQAGKHPILLSNQSKSYSESGVSRVTEDIFGSMKEIVDLFSGKNVASIALYAVNPDSASDSFKKEAFLKSGGNCENVFENEGSLTDCFARFYEQHKKNRFGGIVCVNDFAAISLICHLKEHGADIASLDIISYSDTLISKCTSPAVSTVRANYKNFGQIAFLIYDSIAKSDAIHGIQISCNWEIIHRETSTPSCKTEPSAPSPLSKRTKSFYGDPELLEMMQIESLLSACDDTDTAIIRAVLEGKKTSAIAEECFLTESALKYRINKMKEICRVENRSALCEFLRGYITRVGDPK